MNKLTNLLLLLALVCFTSCDVENDQTFMADTQKAPLSSSSQKAADNPTLNDLLAAAPGYSFSFPIKGSAVETTFVKQPDQVSFLSLTKPGDALGVGLAFRATGVSHTQGNLEIPTRRLTEVNEGYMFSAAGHVYVVGKDQPVVSTLQHMFSSYRALDLNGNFWYVGYPITDNRKLQLRSPAYAAYIEVNFANSNIGWFISTDWTDITWHYGGPANPHQGHINKGDLPAKEQTLISAVNAALKSEGFGIDLTETGPAAARIHLGDLYKKPVGATFEMTLAGETVPGVWKKTDENTWSPYSGYTNFTYFKLTPKPRSTGSKLDIKIDMYGYIPVLPAGGNPFTPKPVSFTVGDFSDAEGTVNALYTSFATRDSRGGLWFVNVGDNTSSTRLQLRSPNYNANIAILYKDPPADFINDGWDHMDWQTPGRSYGTIYNNTDPPQTTTGGINRIVNIEIWPAPKF